MFDNDASYSSEIENMIIANLDGWVIKDPTPVEVEIDVDVDVNVDDSIESDVETTTTPETETETETETENLCEKEKRKSPDLKNAIKPVNSFVKNKVLVSESLSLVDSDDEDINAYLNEFGKKVVLDVQEWLIKNKIGKEVDKDFICRQIRNFQERQRK